MCVVCAMLLAAAAAVSPVAALDVDLDPDLDPEALPVTVHAAGGSPLLLHVTVYDPEKMVDHLRVETSGSLVTRVIPAGRDDSGRFSIPVAPFAGPGDYELRVEFRGDLPEDDRGEPHRFAATRSFRVTFLDYVWGRDNFRFANDSRYRGDVDSYSRILFPWLETRFEPVDETDRAVLLHFAYELLREQLGLCYAFAGGAVRYFRYPELLPRFSDSIYDVREQNIIAREEMNFLQNDLVFERFVARPVEFGAPDMPDIREAIEQGSPVVVGVLAPERHHAMVAYGLIEDHATGVTTVVAANNWDRGERDNLSNPSVENLRVYPDNTVRWPDARHAPYRNPTHLLAVRVRQDYDHDRTTLDELVARRRRELVDGDRRVLILEGVRAVRFVDVPDSGAEHDPVVTRINRNMLVDVPASIPYEIEFTALDQTDDPEQFQVVRSFEVWPDTSGVVRARQGTVVPEARRVRLQLGD